MQEATVRMVRGAIHVSDPDPAEAQMVRNARHVLEGATETLNTPFCTLREARFTATELARSVADLLDIVEPDTTSN